MKAKPITSRKDKHGPLAKPRQRKPAVGVGVGRGSFRPVAGLEHFNVCNRLHLAVYHAPADRAQRRQHQRGHRLGFVSHRDPIGDDRLLPRLANGNPVGRADHQVRRRLERAVRGGARGAVLESDEVGRQPIGASPRPDLDELVGDALDHLGTRFGRRADWCFSIER